MRTEMAEGILRNMYPGKYKALSAGVIASSVNPYAIKVMDEIGIDISHQHSKNVEEFRGKFFSIMLLQCVITQKKRARSFQERYIFTKALRIRQMQTEQTRKSLLLLDV